MNFPRPLSILSLAGLAMISPVWAFPFDDTLDDLPQNQTLNGIETRTSGTVATFNIPIENWPQSISFTTRGGDGGRARATAAAGSDRSANGGTGTTIMTAFDIAPSESGALRPGGELMFIVGSKGENQAPKNDMAGGGGGGASGILYRPPVDGADWELLVIAGGGGGAAAGTVVNDTFDTDGGNGNTGENGGGTGGVSGGSGGSAGTGRSNASGGGAGWLSDAAGQQGGENWSLSETDEVSERGSGGFPFSTGSEGGFGICGGGAGYRINTATDSNAGGGGGGGYSGGSSGDHDAANPGNHGGGGGSYVDSRSTSTIRLIIDSNNTNGSIQIASSPVLSADSLSPPSINLNGQSSLVLDYNEGYSELGASAEDFYENTVSVSIDTPSGLSSGVVGSYTVNYTATDQFGRTSTATRSVEIQANQPPSIPTISNSAIDENTTTVGALSATDPEGDNLTFAITGGGDQNFFEILNGNTLVFKNAPDFENIQDNNSDNLYNVRVASNDGTSSSSNATIQVSIQDINEAPATPIISSSTVSENTTAIGTLSAVDPEGDSLSFLITGGSDQGFFEILNGNTLAFTSAPDFENPQDSNSDNVYTVQIGGRDGALSSSDLTVQVTVQDANETPSAPTISNSTIDENTTTVGTLTASDPDGDSLSFVITGGNTQDLFEVINGNTLAFKSAPDFENPQDNSQNNVYNLQLASSDGSNISSNLTVQIIVRDVAEAPARPEISNSSISENTTTIGTLSSSDPEGDTITFAISSGSDRNLFEIINGDTLAFKEASDFENPQDNNGGNDYFLRVTASDGANVSAERSITVMVTNEDEAPNAPEVSNSSISENITIVGTLSATDPEGTDVTYNISSGTDQDFFEIINGNTLAFKSAPDFEDAQDNNGENDYFLRVTSSDGVNLSSERSITVIVTDVAESDLSEFRSTYQLASDGSDDGADWSGNGVANVLYLAFGLGDPSEPNIDRSRLPATSEGASSDTVTYRYVCPVSQTSGLTFSVLSSADLTTWSTPEELGMNYLPIETITTDLGDGYEAHTVTFNILESEDERFYCLKIE